MSLEFAYLTPRELDRGIVAADPMKPEAFEDTQIAFRRKSDRADQGLLDVQARREAVDGPHRQPPREPRVGAADPRALGPSLECVRALLRGESVEECAPTIEALDEHGVGTILDFSVEGKDAEEDFERGFQEILATADAAAGDARIPFCVFKVSGIARNALLAKVSAGVKLTAKETAEFERVVERIDAICRRAADGGTYVLVDAEESWIQSAIDEVTLKMCRMYNTNRVVVFNTYQLYRHDRLQTLLDDLQRAREGGFHLGVKLVRGAYMEKERERAAAEGYPSPIQSDKASTDRDFEAALAVCAENTESLAVCVGTHKEKSSAAMTALMARHDIEESDPRAYFSQLQGMSDHVSFNLAAAGYNVAKYVPYGPLREVVPYLIRRAEENTSVAGQTGRELRLILDERARRAQQRALAGWS